MVVSIFEFWSVTEMDGHGQSDTRFLWTSDTDSGKFPTSNTDKGSDMEMSDNLGHGLEHGPLLDTRVRPSLFSKSIKR